jgi:TIR domain
MGGIFISYRRDDSGPYAGRLRDTLSQHFGAEQVFRDIDSVDPGERFPRLIEQEVGSCDALLALIGPGWLAITDDAGRRRLDDPDDFVRLEIATALGRSDVLVIPVLVGATSMPAAADLPKPLAALVECNAVRITDENWDAQVARLTGALEKVVKPRVVASLHGASRSGGRWLSREKLILAIVVPVCLALLSAALTWWINRPKTELDLVKLDVVPGSSGEGPNERGEVELVPPKIRVTLRNIGDQVSVVTGAELEILDYAYWPQCQPGAGPMLVSQSYNAVLPVDPRPHDIIPVEHVAQEIAPNGTDQFEFALQLRNPDAPGTHMYQLKVSLTRDGSHNIDAGVAVVGAPEVFDSNPTTEDLAASGEVGECFRRLAIDYRRVQDWQGVRPAEYFTT